MAGPDEKKPLAVTFLDGTGGEEAPPPEALVSEPATAQEFSMREPTRVPDALGPSAPGDRSFAMPEAGAHAPRPDGLRPPPSLADAPVPEVVARARPTRGTLASRDGAPPPRASGAARRPEPPTLLDETADEAKRFAATVADGGLGFGRLAFTTVASLLPAPWRRRYDGAALPWTTGGVLSGLVEALAAGVIWAVAFATFAAAPAAEAGAMAAGVMDHGVGDAGDMVRVAQMGGLAVWLVFAFTPKSLLIGSFCVEGIVRALAAGISQEVHGTYPLALAAKALSTLRARGEAAERSRDAPDEVQTGVPGCALRVVSVRAKDWDKDVTVHWQGEHYRLLRVHETPAPPRRFLYDLRPATAADVIRRLVRL